MKNNLKDYLIYTYCLFVVLTACDKNKSANDNESITTDAIVHNEEVEEEAVEMELGDGQYEQLLTAVTSDDVEKLKELLDLRGFNVDTQLSWKDRRYGESLTSIAIEANSPKVLNYLITNEANIDENLVRAIRNDIDALKLLITQGADVHAKPVFNQKNEKYGEITFNEVKTPLISIAAALGKQGAMTLLLEKGAEIDLEPYPNNKTPLIIACQNGDMETIKFLLDHNADINKGMGEYLGYTNPLYGAVSHGHIDVVKFLLSKGAKFDKSQVVWHLNLKDAKMFEFLLEEGMEVNVDGAIDVEDYCSRLCYALLYEDKENVKYLISKGATIDQTILFRLNNSDHCYILDLANYQFDKSASQVENFVGDASIYSVLSYKNKEVVECYLKHGFNPNSNTIATLFPCCEGQTAKMEETTAIFKMVLQHKEQHDSEFSIDKVFEFHEHVIYPFLHKTVPDNRTTLLSLAVIANNKEAVKVLLELGADPGFQDEHGKTALDYAQKKKGILKLLQN